MSSGKVYPQWGAFGAEVEASAPQSQDLDNGKSELVFDLTIEIGDFKIETLPSDTKEQIEAAMQKAHELDTLRRKARCERLQLVRCDHPLKDFIEKAMARAEVTSFDETAAVWRRLVAMAEEPDAPPHVTGYSPADRAIRYQGRTYDKSGKSDLFNSDALAQLFRRQKAHADQREPTRTDAG
jgi:hypothetical protein